MAQQKRTSAWRAGTATAVVLLMMMFACSPHAAADDPQLRGLLIRPKRDFKPKELKGIPEFFKDLLKLDVVTKLFDMGFSKLRSVGSHGYYSLHWDTPDNVLGGVLTDSAEAALPVIQKTLGLLGLEVFPDYGVNRTVVPNDSLWNDVAASMQQIAATTAWGTTTGSTTIKVCIIDSGIQYTHPDLAANMPEQLVYDAITNSIADASNDGNGHGTHVAGTVAAAGNNALGVAGVSWTVNMIGCKFLGAEGNGNLADAVECIRWCREQGAKITSNSWGSSAPISLTQVPGLLEEMQAAEDAGMLFVAAAGNSALNVDNVDTGPGDATLASVINVGAVDSADQMASFSNFGRATVHLFAPGVDILSTYPGDQYERLSGTSMACPHVSGAAALLWGHVPGATYGDVRRAILAGVDVVAGASESITGGRLNVANALQQLIDPSSPAPTPPPPAAASPPAGGCQDQTTPDQCTQWAAQGYCEGANVAFGQLVYVLCASTCNACDRCEDFDLNCPSYAAQGYCPYFTSDGYSVSDVICRQSCQSCGVALASLSLPSLDISGIWITDSAKPDVYIYADPGSGTGYALWLENPPQKLRLQSLGNDTWVATDVQGGQYKLSAESTVGDSDALADSLTVGDGDEAVTWTRNTSVTVGLRKYKIKEGDTLDSIAGEFNTTADELTQLNPFLLVVNGTLPANLPIVLPGSSFDGVAQLFSFTQSQFDSGANAAATFVPGTSLPGSPPLTP